MNAFSVQDDKRKTCQICQDRRHTADKCLERKESGKPVDVDNKKGEKGSQDKKNNRNDVKKESQKKIQSKENNSNNKIPKSINNSKASGDIDCYKCKRKGHIKKICPLILNTNMMEVKFNSMEMANLVIKVKSAPKNCKNQEFVLDLDNFEVVEMGARKLFYVQGIY
jgi:seryl-tRNA synthetase